jgi:hypothetical protein
MKKFAIIILTILVIPLACKKRYPEGPLISLSSSWGRLKGNHTLTKYTVDGVDSLSLYYDSLGLTHSFYYSDVYGEDIWEIKGNRKDGKIGTAFYEISFVDNKKAIHIDDVFNATGTGPFEWKVLSASWNWKWEILKLKGNDIRMKTTYNGKEYFIELK